MKPFKTSAILLIIGMSSAVAASLPESQSSLATQIARIEAAAAAPSADATVAAATEEVMALIRDSLDYAKQDPERFHTEVESLLRPVIDFPRFARSVMGVWYKKATPEQRERFAESFKWTLVRTYASALTEFHDGDVRLVPNAAPSRNPDQATVTMEITYQGKPYMVVYAMQRRDNRWSLVNVVIEGINLRLNYRSQFDSAMKGPEHGRDLERVIQAWTNVITEHSGEQS